MATSQFLNLDTDGTLSTNSDTVVPSERAIKTYVDSKTVSADSTTIENNANVLSAIGIKDQNTGNADKFWTGTKAEYENVATKDSNTTYRTTDEAEPESVRRIGEIVPSLLPLFDAGLHLLDGSVLSGVGVYSAFVSYVAGLATNYPNLFTTEASWQTSVSAYGVCGKFVYDSVNNTVRLPKITGIIEGTTDTTALGDLIEAGLPNIKGEYNVNNGYTDCYNASSFSTGPFYNTATFGSKAAQRSNTNNTANNFGFDASRCSSLYKDSFNKVQPQTIRTLYYICIATSVKTAIEADIDEIASDLNLKAGTDLANLANAGKIVGAGLGMPSSIFTDLTLGASGSTYTAPANGWFVVRADGNNANTGGILTNTSSGIGDSFTTGNAGSAWLFLTCPALKGQIILFDYSSLTTVYWFRFVYAEGSKSEKV